MAQLLTHAVGSREATPFDDDLVALLINRYLV
jgi:hypothetical protein